MTVTSSEAVLRPGRELKRATQVIGYALSTLLLGVTGLLFIPAAVQSAGPHGWASVALGQAFGVVVAVVVGYGWTLTGPAAIAGSSLDGQILEFRKSLVGRLLVGVPATGLGLALLWILFPGNETVSGLALLGTAMTGMSSNWLFVGMARPFALLWYETVPRTVATVAAIVVLYNGFSLESGLIIQSAGLAVGLVLTCLVIRSWKLKSFGKTWKSPHRLSMSVVVRALRAQSHGMVASLISAIFLSAPILVVGLFAPSALPAFALADKIQKQFISGVAPIVSVAQGWVPKAEGRTAVIRRSRKAVLFGAAMSFVVCVFILLLGSWLWAFLGAGQIEFEVILGALVAGICALIFLERILSRAGLIPLGGAGKLLMATSVGSVLGMAAAVVLVSSHGTAGALLGVFLGFLLTVGFEVIFWMGLTRSLGRRRRKNLAPQLLSKRLKRVEQ
ncbi:hypothetical protein ACFVYC_10915 [Pseudarthrobacter sp. NPDC058329]|uniref:hypothetical protein n=1 Tax=Pseudarthrobacter sp. NPDC058329 TaxID=3346448 RepID=UPI0036DE2B0D